MFDLLLTSIAKHVTLSAEEESHLTSLLKTRKVKRKQFLLKEGEINKEQYFVTEGCLRSYTIDKDGFEHVLQFAPAGWWMADISSLISKKPGTLTIDAIFDTDLIVLLRSDVEKLYDEIPKFERYFRILAENALMSYQQRLLDNMGLPARDRYNNFCRNYPSLIQSLPQKQVASYIGVTPEFLSKMLNMPATRPND